MPDPTLTVILPAHDEEAFIGRSLGALMASDGPSRVQVVVVANGCSDRTVEIARSFADTATARGWALEVLDLPNGGKPGALNAGDALARSDIRVYLDADVQVDPGLLSALVKALSVTAPRYASGRPRVPQADSPVTRAYARFWARLPFVTDGVPGFGLFAVNSAGRQRWKDFPNIISDDTFVRLNFAPEERVMVPAGYDWPMVEGFCRLVRVRRRQDLGVAEVAATFPGLMTNHGVTPVTPASLVKRAVSDPLGFVIYSAVSLAVRLGRSKERWARGR